MLATAGALTLPSRGRPQAGFAHLRPPLMSNVRRRNHGQSRSFENPRRQSRRVAVVGLRFQASSGGTYAVHPKRSTQKPSCSCSSGLRLVGWLRQFVTGPKIVEFTWARGKQRRAWSGVRERRRVLRISGVSVLRWPRLRWSEEWLLRSQNLASLAAAFMAEREPNPAPPNLSIEGASTSKLRLLAAAPHVKR